MSFEIYKYVDQLIEAVELPAGLAPKVVLCPEPNQRALQIAVDLGDDQAPIGIRIPAKGGLGRKKTAIKRQFTPEKIQGAVAQVLNPRKLDRETRGWVRRHLKHYAGPAKDACIADLVLKVQTGFARELASFVKPAHFNGQHHLYGLAFFARDNGQFVGPGQHIRIAPGQTSLPDNGGM